MSLSVPRGLVPPLPDGLTRQRRRRDDEANNDTPTPNSTPQRTQSQAHSATRKRVRNAFQFPSETANINFDGGTRNNGSINAKSAIGIFVDSYDNPYTFGRRDKCLRNNQA